MLLYPAELIRTIEGANEFGISAEIKNADFQKVMQRMRDLTYEDTNRIKQGLTHTKNIDYYNTTAEFIAPYTLKIGKDTITSKMIFLCIGSKPMIPPIKGLGKEKFLISQATRSSTWTDCPKV